MHTRMRMIAAGAAVALLTGTAGAAAAATGAAAPSPSAKPSAAGKPSPPPGKPGDQKSWLAGLAASLHVSVAKLNSALMDAKQTMGRLQVGPTDPRVVAAVAHDLGVSPDKARWLLKQVFSTGGPPGKQNPAPGTPDAQIVQALAAVLHISDARATQVLIQLERIDQPNRGGVDLNSPQYRAIAASLHLTAQQLSNALMQMKQSLAGASGASTK